MTAQLWNAFTARATCHRYDVTAPDGRTFSIHADGYGAVLATLHRVLPAGDARGCSVELAS